MIKPQRAAHRLFWFLLTPLLAAMILYFAAPDTELSPPNSSAPVSVTKGELP